MGKICYINGQPFMVTIPTGGKGLGDQNNQWDDLISFLGGDCNHIFHCGGGMSSWCQEKTGRSSLGYWYSLASRRSIEGGFRPILIPLNPGTLKPDPFLLEDIPDGRVFAVASLYMDGKVIKNPTNPISEGDITDYIPGAEITLGNRDPDPVNWIYVIKYKDILWTDRNILKWISWDDLEQQGFVD